MVSLISVIFLILLISSFILLESSFHLIILKIEIDRVIKHIIPRIKINKFIFFNLLFFSSYFNLYIILSLIIKKLYKNKLNKLRYLFFNLVFTKRVNSFIIITDVIYNYCYI